MPHIGTYLYTLFNGVFVGKDQLGNRYYQSKKADNLGKKKRWVIYNNPHNEASSVPAEWHGWLHHSFDDVLRDRHDWQKPHEANQTGTKDAYQPYATTGERYEAWKPK